MILISFYIYLHLGLSFFPATQRFALDLYHSLLDAIGTMGEAPAPAFLAVLFLITRYVLKTLRFFFEQVIAGKVKVAGLDAEVAPITYRIIRILIVAFVAVIAYPYIPGSDSPAFKGIPIFTGVLFSLGSSSAIANLIAGVEIMSAHYSLIRDGSRSTIPEDYLPPDYEAPAIMIATTETKGKQNDK